MKLLLVEDDREIQEMLGTICGRRPMKWSVRPTGGMHAGCSTRADRSGAAGSDDPSGQRDGRDGTHPKEERGAYHHPVCPGHGGGQDLWGWVWGADDYITKPFSVAEVLARVRANIRRVTQYAEPPEKSMVLTAGALRLDGKERTVTKAGGADRADRQGI